jgi:hypothetical protein
MCHIRVSYVCHIRQDGGVQVGAVSGTQLALGMALVP